jgi:hypothetical protein
VWVTNFNATAGISDSRDGVDHSEDFSVAARNALLTMIDHVTERAAGSPAGLYHL